METRTISIKEIIGRIKDHPILERVPVDTLVDYSVDFLRLMGIPDTFDEKTAILSIDKFKAKLPDDFLKMIAVRTSNFRSELNIYVYDTTNSILCPDAIYLEADNNSNTTFDINTKENWEVNTYDYVVEANNSAKQTLIKAEELYVDFDYINENMLLVDSNIRWTSKIYDDFIYTDSVNNRPRGYCGPTLYYRYTTDNFHMSPKKTYRDMLTYKLQGDYLISSQMYGKVEISYKSMALDECGFPLLPDDAKFIRALEAYIKYKRFLIEFEVGRLPLQVLEKAEQDYYYAKGACIAGFHLTSMDKFEAAINTWKNFLIRDNEHQRGYATLGDKEYLRVH